jgi:pimeloyl-ACP methyl ester carboxylesterase
MQMPEVQVSQGPIDYRDEGSGPVIVFVHGLLVDGRVWDRIVPLLSARARCIVPDLPLGAHRRAMNADAELSPPALARLIAELLERLGLEDVTLVGNDTGGALCQIVAADHPERLARLALITCDAFENFPPRSIAPAVKALGRVPGSIRTLDLLGRLRPARKATMAIAPLTVDPVPDALVKSWLVPLHDAGVRRDLRKVVRAIDPQYTLRAAERLKSFHHPALVVWGMRDKFFPAADAQRLVEVLPQARLERVENARTFVQLDAPEHTAELLGEFVGVSGAGAA